MEILTQNDDPRLSPFLSLKDRKDGTTIVDGPTAVKKLLGTTLRIKRLVAPKEFFAQIPLDRIDECLVLEKSLSRSITGISFHNGIMAWAETPNFNELDPKAELILVLNRINKPDNVGAIIRNAVGMGVDQIIIDTETSGPFLRRCIRASMGNSFYAKFHRTDNLLKTLESLKKTGFQLYCLDNRSWSKPIGEEKIQAKSAFLLGNEGHGVEVQIDKFCDKTLAIPIADNVGHYNVACASAISLYEYRRQNPITHCE